MRETINESKVEELIDRGMAELQDFAGGMREVYEALLTQRAQRAYWPIYLNGCRQPLPPVTLATLLLPLPAAHAKDCSLAGWKVENPDWNIIVSPGTTPNLKFSLPQGEADRSLLCAEAIVARDPKIAMGPQPEVAKILKFARHPLSRVPRDEDLPGTELIIRPVEQTLICRAAEGILREAEEVPGYMKNADPKVREAYRQQMRARADYAIAWAIRLHPSGDLTPWLDYLTRENVIGAILENWQQRKPQQVLVRAIANLNQALPAPRSSNA